MEEERAAEQSEEAVGENTGETAEVAPSIAECDVCRNEESVAEHDEEIARENIVETASSSGARDACRGEESVTGHEEEAVEKRALSSGEYDACRKGKKEVLEREDELLQKIIETHNAVKNAAINREWTDFEALAISLEAYKDAFDELEEERIALFAPDAGEPAPHFYTMVSHLPEEERKELSDLYRSVKDRALKLQIANEALLRYLNEARSIINEFMRAAFPDRKSGVYSRRGTRVSSDMRSLILDQIL
ncbi:MAG: flagellar export chaperone FlgN [Treponema sp.]|jgi:hypothetical protein|nr:flagellar export chaperone FlgN [Treponema sp.]